MNMKLYEKIGYGLGDTASSIFWKLFGVYLLYFYTDVVGLDVAVTGTMFLVTRIWDSCFDPVVGVIADRTDTRWGKFRPYLLWMAVPFGIMGVLTFSSPEFSLTWKTGFAYLTYSLMMMVYSLINVPYATLLGVLSDDPRERVSLSSYKMAFAALGSILALALIEPLVKVVRATPVASIVILTLVWISSRNLSVIISFMMVFPIVYSNVLEGIRNTDHDLLEAAEVYRIRTIKRIRYIYVPSVLPYFSAAVKAALGLAWKSGIAAEVIGLPSGSIGERVYEAKIYLSTPDLFAWTVVIIVLAFIFERVFLSAVKLLAGRAVS